MIEGVLMLSMTVKVPKKIKKHKLKVYSLSLRHKVARLIPNRSAAFV